MGWTLDIGAGLVDGGGVLFRVWAPFLDGVSVRVLSKDRKEDLPLQREGGGYFSTLVKDVPRGSRYLYLLRDGAYPDPASRFQPEGVHRPSQLIDPGDFQWDDAGWSGVAVNDLIIYEIHVGTFTKEGTFDAAIPYLRYLRELGVTAIELMPVCQFPGGRNWGYDGVHPYAPQNSYGGPGGIKRLINECHRIGMAVVLDLVYNHLGPEGNYLGKFGPYFTDRYKTPWGDAINFDGPYSDDVRHFFIQNALYWIHEYHIDALRLDAVHAVFDFGPRHFLQELAEKVHEQGQGLKRHVYVIAESTLNDVRLISPADTGGYGVDAQWNDDFHHSLHSLITGERSGYYEDFGDIAHFEKAYCEGFVYSGEYSAFRKKRHGSSSKDVPPHRLVVFSQNHDQVGNRAQGERLSALVPFETLKLAAGAVLLSPYIPLLFMGEEYGEDAPFLYFVSHTDETLAEAVREGRTQMFRDRGASEEVPDPLKTETFLRSRIDWQKRGRDRHKVLLEFYREVIRLRTAIPALSHLDKESLAVSFSERERTLSVRRWHGTSQTCCVMNFSGSDKSFMVDLPAGRWKKLLDSSEEKWRGPGPSLPPETGPSPQVTMRGWGIALFSREG